MVGANPATLFPVEQFVPTWVLLLKVGSGFDDELAERIDGHRAIVIRTCELHMEVIVWVAVDVA
jgi:hypothetical protein